MANDVDKQIYGSYVPVLKDEKLSVRVLVSSPIFIYRETIEHRPWLIIVNQILNLANPFE